MNWKKIGLLSLGTATMIMNFGCSSNNLKQIEMQQAYTLVQGGNYWEIYQKYADEGDAEAQARLAYLYITNYYSSDLIYKYASLAAKQNHPLGLYCMGIYHNFWNNDHDDDHITESYYLRAIELGYDHALLALAELYSTLREVGESPLYNSEKAEIYYKKALEKKVPLTESRYSNFLYKQQRYDEILAIEEQGEDYFSLLGAAFSYQNLPGKVNIAKALELAKKAQDMGRPNANFDIQGLFMGATCGGEIFYFAALEHIMWNGYDNYSLELMKYAVADEYTLSRCPEIAFEYARNLIQIDAHYDEAKKYLKIAADNNYKPAYLLLGLHYIYDEDLPNAIKYLSIAATVPEYKVKALEILAGIYHDTGNILARDMCNLYGFNLESTSGRNNVARKQLTTYGDDQSFAYSAALFALSSLEENNFADRMLAEIMQKDGEKLKKLAEESNGDALFALSVILKKNAPETPEYKQGDEYFKKAVELKHPIACYIMANMYSHGIEVEHDLKKAMDYYQISAEQGFLPATKNIVFLIWNYRNVFQMEWKEMQKWCEMCMEQGGIELAKHYADLALEYGNDTDLALSLYQNAIDQGDSNAMVGYATYLLEQNDIDNADNYFNMAANEGNYYALTLIGMTYSMMKNYRWAYINFVKSYMISPEENFNLEALAQCYRDGLGCEQSKDRFLTIANQALQLNSAPICLILGDAYYNGLAVEKDLKKAEEYYKIGSERGDKDCQKALKTLSF